MPNIIEVKSLSYKYDEDLVLEDVNLEIEKGSWISIVGHNGSGKSTLSKILVSLLHDFTGEVLIDGIKLSEENDCLIRDKIGIVFQNPDNQFVGTTVKDDIAFGLENRCLKSKDMMEIIEKSLSDVGMNDFINHEPHKLSGGQKQRVAIASVLALDTDIIILDEATSMLDPEGRKDVLELIKTLKNHNKTLITITHDLEETLFSDKIIVLNKGKIVDSGDVQKVLSNEEVLKSSNLDVLETTKLLELTRKSDILKDNKELLDLLCELNFKM